MIKLVAFLGNYGREYENTRHNAAWLFASSLPFYERLYWQDKFKGKMATLDSKQLSEWLCEFKIISKKDGSPVLIPEEMPSQLYFLKPQTYMNLSGESIIELASFYKIKPEETLIVHDEIELPLGTLSLKFSGGLGGHNGLRSTKAVFGTADFWRLRFGISKPSGVDIASYVLGRFTAEQEIELSQVFAVAAELFGKVIFSKDPARLIPEWGKKKVSAEVK